jgi:hypothetical protein
MDRDEISNLYRRPSVEASYQVSVHLAKRFQRRRLKKIGVPSKTILENLGSFFKRGSGSPKHSF